MNWSGAMTNAQIAFKRAENHALMKHPDQAVIALAESRAWLEIAMHILEREA